MTPLSDSSAISKRGECFVLFRGTSGEIRKIVRTTGSFVSATWRRVARSSRRARGRRARAHDKRGSCCRPTAWMLVLMAQRPLCFVERAPAVGSPAETAKLRAGDAILQFGDAVNLQDVARLLQPGHRIVLQVMSRDGVVQERIVIPKPFDPKKPQSLLGCQITDICPNRFRPHPALRGLRNEEQQQSDQAKSPPKEPETKTSAKSTVTYDSQAILEASRSMPRWHDDTGCFDESEDDYDEENADLEYFHGEVAEGETDEEFEHEQSRGGAGGSGVLKFGGGARCASVDVAEEEDGSAAGVGQAVALRWRSRCLLLTTSMLNLAHGCAFLAAPSFGSEAKAIVNAFRSDLWRLVSTHCGVADHVTRHLVVTRGDEASAGGTHLTFANFIQIALAVSCLELVLTACGVALALLPYNGTKRASCCQRTRFALVLFYPPAALLLWLLLAAVTMYILTFRWEADDLLRSYWECLDANTHASEAGSKGGAASSARYFESVDVVAAVCASADLSAIFGLFAACSLIGWREVLRVSVIAFGVLSALSGGLMASLGVVLLRSGNLLPATASIAILALGVVTFVFGLLGVLAAKGERIILLKLHAIVLATSSVAIGAFLVLLLVGGVESLHPVLHRLVEGLSEQSSNGLISSGLSATGLKVVVDAADVDEVVALMQAHRLSLSAASVLGLFLLAMNVAMALGLRWIVRSERFDGGGAYEAVSAAPPPTTVERRRSDNEVGPLSGGQWPRPRPRQKSASPRDHDSE